MSFNFEIPVINLDTGNGEKIEIYRMNRAIEILSKSSQSIVLYRAISGAGGVETEDYSDSERLIRGKGRDKKSDV